MKPDKNTVEKIKNFLKKRVLTLSAIAVMLIATGTVYAGINSQAVDMGVNPVNGTNTDKKLVLLSGDGYKLDKIQRQQYNLEYEEPKPEPTTTEGTTTNAAKIAALSTIKATSTLTSSLYRPLIISNMRTQSVETGEEVEFYVIGRTYQKKAIKSKYYTVKYNNKALKGTLEYVDVNGNEYTSGSGVKYEKMTYTFVVKKGSKTVSIKVKDPKKKTDTQVSYAIKGTKARASIGKIAAIIDLDEFDLDNIGDSKGIASKKGDTVQTVVAKAIKDESISITYSNGKITKISGISIPKSTLSELKTAVEAKGMTYKKPSTGVLKTNDIVSGSRWYIYNSSGKEIKSTHKLKKGDTITIRFVINIEQEDPTTEPTDPSTDPTTEPTDPSTDPTQEDPSDPTD